MRLLDWTEPRPEANLAIDEALLDALEQGTGQETLRLWESPVEVVVVGRSSLVAREVNLPACRAMGVPVLRRPSGGAAVVAGPGCLMYAVVLSLDARPHLRAIDEAHRFVLGRVLAALGTLGIDARHAGTSDLALGDRKFSGNSLRVRRRSLLYHGTLLYDFPLPRIAALLAEAPRQPEYRRQRGHAEFVTNLPASRDALAAALAAAFEATTPLDEWPRAEVARLVAEKYSTAAWNEGR